MRPLLALAALPFLMAAGPRLERIVIDDDFPAGYQVEVADVNGDGKPDIVGLGGGTCAWYENPTWRKRIVTGPDRTPDIISSATADLDGDGKAEIAIAYDFAMNEPMRGKLLLASQGKGPDDPWEVAQIASVPSIHRLRWFPRVVISANSMGFSPIPGSRDSRAGGKAFVKGGKLLVAPLFGPTARPPIFDQEPAHPVMFSFGLPVQRSPVSTTQGGGFAGGGAGIGGGSAGSGAGGGDGSDLMSRFGIGDVFNRVGPPEPLLHGKWARPQPEVIEGASAPVIHAVDVVTVDDRNDFRILTANNLGVARLLPSAISHRANFASEQLVAGAPGEAPKKGASEVHVGKLKDGRRFLTTVEPWHGSDVAIYLADSGDRTLKFGPRTVVDTTLVDGHALWVADIDGDGDDEIFAGYRGGKTGVNLYCREGETWTKTVVDGAIAAQDLRGGDLDGDGRPDIVAIGGKTHNLVWYRPIGRP